MHRFLHPATRLAAALALLAVLGSGCQQKNATPTPEKDTNPLGLLGSVPTDEDAEVLAYFKKKGWSLMRDQRLADGKMLVYLIVGGFGGSDAGVAITDEDVKMMGRSKTLQVVDLSGGKTTDDTLKAVAALPRLQGILVKGEGVTDVGIKALAQSKSLDTVGLVQTKNVTGDGVKELAALPKLQMLALTFMPLNDAALEALGGTKTLESLTLEYVDGITDAGVARLAGLPNLNVLKIGTGFGESKLTSAGIKAIAAVRVPAKFEFNKKLIDDDLLELLVAKGWLYGPTPPGTKEKRPATAEEVKSIVLDDSKVTDRGMRAVLPCTNVTSLHLQKTGLTDETLKKMVGFKKLDYLALDGTKVTAAGLDAISGLPLKHLSVQECELSEDAFRAFGKMTALEELWLAQTKMKAEWLEHVSALPKLKELNLRSADFNDAAVKCVTSLPNLENLTLNNTSLGDAGFQELLKMPKLRNLSVDGTKISKEVYQQAKKDHPKLSLYYYGYDK